MRTRTRCLTLATVATQGLFASNVANAAIVAKSFSQIVRERRLITGTVSGLTQLTSVIAKPGLTIVNATILEGNPDQFGLFAGGSDSIGVDSGVIISTGGIGNVKGPNQRDSTTSQYGGAGYAPLDKLVTSGITTQDAAVLQIDFKCDSGQSEEFHLQYVWASEEYNEYVNDQYNDVFAFFLNGLDAANNVATLPDGTAVAINSVNCGNPYSATSTNPNCDLFVNNELKTRTTEYNIEYDGFTVPLQVNTTSNAGTNTIIIAIADVGDDKYDSALMLGEGSLLCGPLSATNTPTATPAASKAPTKAPTKKPTAAPITGTKSPSLAPTPAATSPIEPVSPTGPTAAPATKSPSTQRPSSADNGMTVNQCLKKVKNQCNCVLFAKGDSCAVDTIRNKCNFSKTQRQNGAKQRVLDKYAKYCEC